MKRKRERCTEFSAVVQHPTKLNDICGAKAGFCVETVRRRIAEETGLKKTLSTCSEIVSVGAVAGEDSVEMVTGPIQVLFPCCGKWPTQKHPKEVFATRRPPWTTKRIKNWSRTSKSWFRRAFRSVLVRRRSARRVSVRHDEPACRM